MDETLVVHASGPSAQAADALPPQELRSGKKQKTQKLKKHRKQRAGAGAARRGWGPYKSVARERSVDFNLTLDVQSLQQEIRDMETLRALLQAKALVQCHSVDGSLVRTAREFYCVFRTGFEIPGARRRSVPEVEQRDFLFNTMDSRVDVGNELYGPEVMAQQLQIYSTFVRFLDLSLESVDVISADESVVVATRGTFHFQVLRDTIQGIFPHVMANEALVARLIGRQVTVLTKLTFFFNADGKCVKYQVDIDFLAAFGTIVSDPHDLDLLFGRALIADNCMFGLIESPGENLSVLVEDGSSMISPTSLRPGGAVVDGQRSDNGSSSASAKSVHAQQVARVHQVVRAYFSVFSPASTDADGYSARTTEDRFVANCCEPSVHFGNTDRWVSLLQRWSDLRKCFDAVDFRLVHEESTSYDACLGAYRADTVGIYELGISPRTIELVFPHVTDYPELVAALMHQTIQVESLLTFWVSEDTGKLQRVREHMDLSAAIEVLVLCPADLAFVVQHACISADGAFEPRRSERLAESRERGRKLPGSEAEALETWRVWAD